MDRESCQALHVGGGRLTLVGLRLRLVRQLHYVVEVTGLLMASDVQDRELAGVQSGNRLELLDALKLALERPIVLERASMDDFHGTKLSEYVPRQPHLAVTAPSHAPEQFVLGDGRGRLSAGG